MPSKRPQNDGTIRLRKDGRWEARYVAGTKPDGKLNRKSIYAPTQEECTKKLREILQQIERGEYAEPSKMTVGEWLDIWFKTYGCPRWRDKTAEIYEFCIRKHLKPALGKHVLQKLRTDHIQAFINAQAANDASPDSIRKRLAPLKGALKQAVDDRLIIRNPADNVKLPQPNPKEIEFLNVDEQKALLPHLPDSTAGRAIRFFLGTGLRASELCGLQWGDIAGDSFTIRRSVQYAKNVKEGSQAQKLSISAPKTKAGRRSIPLLPAMRDLLEAQRRAQMEERLQAGPRWMGPVPGAKDCYVFASETGSAFDRNNLARTLRSVLSRAGLKQRGLHALRHTFATNAVRAGMDIRTLSEILGHSKVAFTIQQYVHSDMETKRRSMQAMETLF